MSPFFRPLLQPTCVLLLASIGLSACSVAEPAYLPREARETTSFKQIRNPKLDREEVSSCNMLQRAYDMGGWPEGDDPETIRKIDALVRERFVYSSEETDEWNSRADLVVWTDHHWAGDCDDLAITVVALARCAGVPEDRLGLALARTHGSEIVNHMVGVYTAPDGKSYSVGDTFSPMRPLLAPGQEIGYWAFLDDLSEWLVVESIEDVKDPTRAVVEANRSGK